MLEPDTSKTNKTEENSPGMTEGTKDEIFVCQHLAKVFQPLCTPCAVIHTVALRLGVFLNELFLWD